MADEADNDGDQAHSPKEEKSKMAIRIDPPEYIAIHQSLQPFFEDITDEQRDR